MSTNLEDTILEKVHSLDDEQQKQVLEFVENLEQNVRREEASLSSSGMENGKKDEVDLRERGISPERAADLRSPLSTFAQDWNDPEMDIYDNYDQAFAALNQSSKS